MTEEATNQQTKPSSEELEAKYGSMSHEQLMRIRLDPKTTLEEQKQVAPYEHRAFAREWTQEQPLIAPASLAVATPLYQVAKAVGLTSKDSTSTGPSLEQVKQGYKGISEGVEKAIVEPWKMGWQKLRQYATGENSLPATTIGPSPKAVKKPWEMTSEELARAATPPPKKSTVEPSKGFPVSSYLKTLASVESNNNPTAKAKTSTATGPYQFTASTWMEVVNDLGLDYTLADRTDPKKAKIVAEEFTRQKVEKAKQELGRDPTQLEIYFYHLLGNAKNFLTADLKSEAKDHVTKSAVKANTNIFFNKDGTPKTVQEVKNNFAKKFPHEESKNSSGLLEKGNIDLNKRPVVRNSDGSISTVRSIGVNIDGKEVLIPTVSDDGKILSDEEAIKLYERTGKHLGKFNSVKAANIYAEQLHSEQEKMYKGNK